MPRGFLSLSPEQRKAVAASGGKAVQKANRAFSQDHELARAAGKKGGVAVPGAKRSFSTNQELARESGRKGGRNRWKGKGQVPQVAE